MDTDEEAKKVLWSLQNNKRTETERVNFQPTGPKPRNNGPKYIVIVLVGILALSYVMTQFQESTIYVCLMDDFCFNSYQDKILYTLYVFLTNTILVFGVYFAYKIGKQLSERLLT